MYKNVESSAVNYCSSQYSLFLCGNYSLQSTVEKNQVCEVNLIPGIKIVRFREYGLKGLKLINMYESYGHDM